ncbi:MAG: alpha/beta hydrolase [Pirellulales bacterium]
MTCHTPSRLTNARSWISTPRTARSAPVVFWIHGGGWQTGDKGPLRHKPELFNGRGMVLVSTNYRLLPEVDMGTIIRDIAKSLAWVHKHIGEYGGDPQRIFIMGHSAGAQLAAIIATDDAYLKAEGVSPKILIGCVPVDGDTYDVPLMVKVGEDRRKAEGKPEPKFGHRAKFGTPEQHVEYSAVTHCEKDKHIAPFLLLHVAAHPDVTQQAKRLAEELQKAGKSATLFGADDTDHVKLNANLGAPNDAATAALNKFVDDALKAGPSP